MDGDSVWVAVTHPRSSRNTARRARPREGWGNRARRITEEQEATAVLADAISSGDESLAHALGVKARHNGWVDAADAWSAAYPDSAGSAEALAYIEGATTGAAYNLSNSITYSDPSV